MGNPNDIKNPGTSPTGPAEESEEELNAAQQAWKDRQGIPRGTPEEGERSADRVGGSGPAQPQPEIEDEENESSGQRPETDDVGQDPDRRRATPAEGEPGEE